MKTKHVEFTMYKELPSPYDAIVRGEEISFREIEAISFRVTSSTAFKKDSTGFLTEKSRHLLIMN